MLCLNIFIQEGETSGTTHEYLQLTYLELYQYRTHLELYQYRTQYEFVLWRF